MDRIEVNTREYEFDHGKKPRGTGRWAFWMGYRSGQIGDAHWFHGSYGDAVRQAKAKARELGHTAITVGS